MQGGLEGRSTLQWRRSRFVRRTLLLLRSEAEQRRCFGFSIASGWATIGKTRGNLSSGFRTKMAVAFCTKMAVDVVPKWPWITSAIHKVLNLSY